VRQSRKGEPAFKLWVTRLGYFILNKVTSINLPIEAGDFKLISRRVVNHLIRFQEKKPFLRGLVCWVGYKQAFVPYHREARFVGETKFNIFGRDVIGNFLDSALISFSSAPLRISIFLGFVSILVVFVMLVHVLSEKLQGKAIPGWTAIMLTMLFIGSVQLLCTGILGLYINSIFEETKRRPNFIIDETFGFPKNDPHKDLDRSPVLKNFLT
jgi:dolichol-phosphate mannosyltransferase